MDEFEKRMQFAGFITTLADAVTKMNPITLLGQDSFKNMDTLGLKDVFTGSTKKYLDMLNAYIDKARDVGSRYPIEDILGIKTDATPQVKS